MYFEDDTSGIWNIDHIIEPSLLNNSCNYLLRLIRYHEDIYHKSGVRYLPVDKTFFEDFRSELDFGSTVYWDSSWYNKLKRISGASYLPIDFETAPLEPDKEHEIWFQKQISEIVDVNRVSESKFSKIPEAEPVRYERSWSGAIWGYVHVFNVGQGDTIILELPEGQIWVVDARLYGRKKRKSFDDWMIERFGRKKIHRLIVSHYHYDHIHSVPYLMREYQPDEVVVFSENDKYHTTASTRRIFAIANNNIYVLPDEEITQFGQLSIQLNRTDVFSNIKSKDPNQNAISVALKTDKTIALLAGDMPGWMCNDLINTPFFANASDLKSKYYKVTHHCSRTGNDNNFFTNYAPNYSVTSCSNGNRYGHPHCPPKRFLDLKKHRLTYQADFNKVDSFKLWGSA